MDHENALAAGQGGSETQPPTTVLSPDEVHRQCAVHELAGYLATSGAMLARCEALSNVKRGDRLGPVYAAARLMNAGAHVTKALAHVALVETRRRTITERIQPALPKDAELNSPFAPLRDYDDARAELKRRIDNALEVEARERERLEGLAIGCFI